MNRPVRIMVLVRTVPGGTGFGANRPVTIGKVAFDLTYIIVLNLQERTMKCSKHN